MKKKSYKMVKRNEPSINLGTKTGSIHLLSVITNMILILKIRRHRPSDALHNPSHPFKFLSTDTYFISHGGKHEIYQPLTLRCVYIEKVAVLLQPSLTKTKTHKLSLEPKKIHK